MKLKLNAHKMPHDVLTRWNSTFDMLAFALEYKAAVNDIAGNRVANLRQFELSDEEWQIVEQPHDTLKVGICLCIFYGSSSANSAAQIFKDATLFFSHSTPSLATVIPAMDHINETLTSQSIDPKYEPSIHATLSLVKKVLNHYYSATDQWEVYHIAMGM